MKINTVIFDVDGVLLDTIPYHFQAWKKVFNELEIDFNFNDYLMKVNGLPRIIGITNILSSIDKEVIDEIAKRKQEYFLEKVEKEYPRPLSGVISFLKILKKKNINIAAASSSKNAFFLLKKARISSYFDEIITGNDFTKSKPDSELFLIACNRLSANPWECLVVEDAAVGVQAAINAKMKTVGLLSSRDNKIVIADLVINSLQDYRKILENFIFTS